MLSKVQSIKDWIHNHTNTIIKLLWIATLSGVLLVVGLLAWAGSSGLPTFEQLENPQYDEASVIYDDKGRSFGKYYVENREPIKFKELNPHIHNALIATEDNRFYNHSGVDIPALFRVAVKTLILSDKSSGGGSTISQQLAKLLFKRPSMRNMGFLERSVTLVGTKLKEWITAVRLESNFTKEEIIALYLNKFEFINGAHGIQAASQTYFNVNQDQLNPDEAAVLVGMLQNPSLYNPRRFPEISKERRDIVMSLMKREGSLSQGAFDTLSVKPIDMSNFMRAKQSDGPAPYFRAELTKFVKQLLEENNIRKEDGTTYNIYTDGLTINTTIDLDYQKYAEEAVSEHMTWLQKRFDNVWKNRDPWTYEADENQKDIRAETFISRMKSSERYASIRAKNLDSTIESINKSFPDLSTSDNVFKSLIAISKGKSSFSKEIENRKINKDDKSSYQKLISSNKWELYKKAYEEHEADFLKTFDTPVKMMIYDHELGEKEVEMSPRDSVKYHNMMLQNGTLAVDPKTGYIKAWVGGVNHKYFKYDHTTTRRSVGSTLKPFVYTAAMAFGGIKPCQTFDDIQYTIAPGDANFYVDKEWSPANANGKFSGNKYNLYHGLLYSKNSITVRLIKELGNVDIIRDLLDNVGISKTEELSDGRLAVPNVPSISLGAVDIRLFDMVGAYTTFANQGTYVQPIFIKNIVDKNGKVIYSSVPKRNAAINPLYNAIMVDMLRNNTGGSYGMGLKSQYGGKTGTTNDYSDGWFMGVTPELIIGVWTGGDDKWIRFLSLDNGQGFVMARPVAQKLLKKLEADSMGIYNFNAKFADPPEGFADMIDCEKYKQVDPEVEQESIIQNKIKQDQFEEEFDEEF